MSIVEKVVSRGLMSCLLSPRATETLCDMTGVGILRGVNLKSYHGIYIHIFLFPWCEIDGTLVL